MENIDLREDLLNRLQVVLAECVPDDKVKHAFDCIVSIVDRYEIASRTTAVAIVEDTTEQALKMFLASKKIEGRSDKSIKRYAYELRRFLDFTGVPITEITAFNVRSYMVSLTMRNLKPATLDSSQGIIVAFCNWLHSEGVLQINPVKNIAPIKVPKEMRKKFSNQDLELLRSNCKTVRDRAMVEFMVSTGCRVSEMTSIAISDVDFINREVVIRGKGNKYRKIYFSELCLMYLKRYLETRTDCIDVLFLSRVKKSISESGVRNLCYTLADSSGVSDVHPHRFRRTFATNMLERGVPVEKVSLLLGHSNVSTTMTYLDITDASIKRAYDYGV